jgi:acyl-CoA thioesterase-1
MMIRAEGGELVVLGDSLAVSPTDVDNFPTELQRRLDATTTGWTVVNAGVSWDTTEDGLRRLEGTLSPHTRILIVTLGANDGLRGIAAATIEQNLCTIIGRAQARGIRVLLCGMETPPFNGWGYARAFHDLFPRVAERCSVPLVPFLLAGVALNPMMNLDDQVHPNSAGARMIAQTIWPYLAALVEAAALELRT